ncbi:tetratricopeptide repeat protein [Cardiobacterium valvarum]|uniref:Predicted O-linked N-acetylglucosamine transferase, SPINDLY family n=1 Tax=Cardiobacterium valvarum TaxID=194702 RepID=A0A381EAT5_9GAMM|nr:tetratricopeptide repeat protein [Cardiobacterium valvarum]SUX24060.1 Predicted O-linked N-acetylglucosamine transferase, SPINDLY family [Cardiobacterium valvarum]
MTDSKKPGDLLNEGAALVKQGKLDEAIAIFRSIKHEDSPEQYAKAQFCLGLVLGQKGDIEGEIKAYRNIKREDSPEMYARAQLNLGFRLGQKRDTKGEIKAYRNIKREDSSEMYAQAQFNLGFALGQKGDIEGSIEVYRNIKREDSSKIYAQAQLNLGFKLGQKGDIEGAIEAYRNIKRENHPESYARAQLNLGSVLEQKDNINEAIEYYQNIKYEDHPELYAKAQFNLGIIFEQKSAFKKAIEHYHNSSDYLYYHANANIKILQINNKRIRDTLYKIGNTILHLINNLIIPLLPRDYEYKLAHYTQASVAWKVIKDLSAFRLGLIKNVNDPMEGLTLHKFLQQSCLLPKDFFNYNSEANYSEHVFISCFTFNHDSLNQFRLYGKENNQEASGVSLVFPSDFFDSNPDNHINAIIGLKNNKAPDLFKEKKHQKNSNSNQPLNKQPLYRCIYLDPDTGYVSLAKRDKATFYRELHAEGKDIEEISKEANNRWNIYINSISNKEEKIKRYLKYISNKIEKLFREQDLSKGKRHILETLHFILLPLQYLVKHAAFQEEQECRMIHITSLDNEKIQLDWESKQVYIEYEPEVKAHLDKIYLSPGALIYEDFFRHELDDPNNPKKRVRISSNPFRNK